MKAGQITVADLRKFIERLPADADGAVVYFDRAERFVWEYDAINRISYTEPHKGEPKAVIFSVKEKAP